MVKNPTAREWVVIIAGSVVAAWAKIPHAEQILLILMGLDLLMGIAGSLIRGDFSARTLFKGIVKKTATLIFLTASAAIESAFSMDLEIDIHKWVAYALCLYEMTSLVESYQKLGGNVPPIFMDWLDKARKLLADRGKTQQLRAMAPPDSEPPKV